MCGLLRFLMEQPAAPQHMPEVMLEVASFWRTEEWRVMKEYLNLDLVTFNQGAYGGMAVKPNPTKRKRLVLMLPPKILIRLVAWDWSRRGNVAG